MHKSLWVLIVLFMLPALSFAQHGHSPYVGQEKRAIKTLSEEEMRALLSGQGMGLAKAAELNHYPGPRHVLDLSAELQLSEAQRVETQKIYDRMHREAVHLGALIIDKERELNDLFATEAVNSHHLQSLAKQIAQLHGDLRLVHLQAHVEMKQVLSREQIDTYDELRGYMTGSGSAPHTGHEHRHH
jgi:Spy/CpxP family protein refolding chaperone